MEVRGKGLGPARPHAAVLHACSLLVPDVAARVFETFAAVLGIPPGRQTQLFAAADLLVMVGRVIIPILKARCVSRATAARGRRHRLTASPVPPIVLACRPLSRAVAAGLGQL